ncbi:MAG: hypothetical protein NVS9B10_14820 [Nevskia sp.]
MLCLLAALLSASAQAFEIKTRSENPAISEDALRAAVNQIAAEVGQRIPETPDIKVYVYSRALPSKIEWQTIYFHRVQLTKAFTGPAPYPTRAWLPIKSVERYGVDDAATARAKLDEALRDFFRALKSVDPDKGPAE